MLPVATAYSIAEAFGFRKGVNLDFRRAPIFISLFSVLVAVGAGVAMIPGLPLISLLVAIQVLNALLLPVILFFMLKLSGDQRLMGNLVNGPRLKVVAWTTAVAVSALAITMLVNLGAEAIGVSLHARDSALPHIVEEFIRPQMEEMRLVYAALYPTLPLAEIDRCSFSMVGQVMFFHVMRPAVLRFLARDEYPRGFAARLADHIFEFSMGGMDRLAAKRRGRRRAG